MKHKVWCGLVFLLLVLCFAGTAAAWAGGRIQEISTFCNGIKIYIDGKLLKSEVEPFILVDKNVTMVPVRSIADGLGKKIVWDKQANAIYVGNPPAGTLSSLQPGVWMDELPVLRNVGPFYRQKEPIKIARRSFGHGVAVKLSENAKAETVVELDEKYEILNGYLGVEDATSESLGAFVLTILADDALFYESPVIKPGSYPYYFAKNVKGVKRLAFQVRWQETEIGSYREVIAALANLRLQ